MKSSYAHKSMTNFAKLWIGQVASQGGTRMYQIALLWWIITVLPSWQGVALGAFLVVGALPAILFVRPIGHLVETSEPRRLLIICDLLAHVTVVLAGLVVAFSEPGVALVAVFIAEFILMTLQGVIDPTISKAIPNLVRQEDLDRAIAFQTSTQSLANFGGAVLAASLIATLGVVGTIALNAASYLVSAVASYTLRVDHPPQESLPAGSSEPAVAAFTPSELPSQIRMLFWGFGLTNFFSTPTLVILPLYTARALSGSASSLAVYEASIWFGMLLGAALSPLASEFRNPTRFCAYCVAGLGLSLSLVGVFVEWRVYLIALFFGHLLLGIANTKFAAYFQETVPSEIKGRFFATLQAMISVTFPLAFFLFGVLADWFSPPAMCLLQGVGLVVMSGYFFALSFAAQRSDSTTKVGSRLSMEVDS